MNLKDTAVADLLCIWDNNEVAWDPAGVICADLVASGKMDLLKNYLNENNFTFNQLGIQEPENTDINDEELSEISDKDSEDNSNEESGGNEEAKCQHNHNEIIALVNKDIETWCTNPRFYYGVSCGVCNKTFVPTKGDEYTTTQSSAKNPMHCCPNRNNKDSPCKYAICQDVIPTN